MKFYIGRTSNFNNSKDISPTIDAVIDHETALHGKIYAIEIHSLDELMKLVNKESRIIIFDTIIPTIEIYDDYRE